MSIASEITRLQNIKTNIRSALVAQGITAASEHDMADFSADILGISTGSEATITVTYASEFYNKPITCTKGQTTLTDTTTSSGSTVFTVDEEGTWTITCNGISIPIDVVFNYESALTVTKTITVYSAAADTVSFSDLTGAKTVTTDANGVGSVSVKVLPEGTNITFTSSVADNPSDLSQKYSKTVTVDKNTTSVYVMPGTPIYWYGWKKEELSMHTNNWANVGTGVWSGDITYYTNSIYHTYYSKIAAIGTDTPCKNSSGTLHVIAHYTSGNSGLSYIQKAAKDINSAQEPNNMTFTSADGGKKHKTCPYSGNTWLAGYVGNQGAGNAGHTYAIWIE